MRRIRQEVTRRVGALRERPFFAFLRDRTIEPARRLGFAPGIAHFVMSFADLYAHVLPEEPPRDDIQRLVNAHTREDAGHWRWYLADLRQLGYDSPVPYVDSLRFVWGDATLRMRMLGYHMCRLGLRAPPIRKLVLVQCIESAGKVTVEEVSRVGDELCARTGKKLVYMGGHHAETESSHALEDERVQRQIEDIVVPEGQARELLDVVNESFDLFDALVD